MRTLIHATVLQKGYAFCVQKIMENQDFINELHMAFRSEARTEELEKWDALIAAIVRKHFPEEQARVFFDVQATFMAVFANDLINFIINFFTEEEETNE